MSGKLRLQPQKKHSEGESEWDGRGGGLLYLLRNSVVVDVRPVRRKPGFFALPIQTGFGPLDSRQMRYPVHFPTQQEL